MAWKLDVLLCRILIWSAVKNDWVGLLTEHRRAISVLPHAKLQERQQALRARRDGGGDGDPLLRPWPGPRPPRRCWGPRRCRGCWRGRCSCRRGGRGRCWGQTSPGRPRTPSTSGRSSRRRARSGGWGGRWRRCPLHSRRSRSQCRRWLRLSRGNFCRTVPGLWGPLTLGRDCNTSENSQEFRWKLHRDIWFCFIVRSDIETYFPSEWYPTTQRDFCTGEIVRPTLSW